MFKEFLMKKMLERQMKDVPAEQRDALIVAVQKNPELFQKIALEVEEKTKQGKGQMAAVMETVKKYQNELKGALGNQ